MFSAIGQVRAVEAEEVPGDPEEVAEAVLQCRVRPVRRDAEAVLRQP